MSVAEGKSWYQSKGVWGGVVAVVAGAAGLLGMAISPEDQELIVQGAMAIGSAIGGLLSVYGRITAADKIK